MRYRLITPMTVVAESNADSHGILISVPAGSVIEVIGEAGASGLVQVALDGQVVSLFLSDLEERGEMMTGEPGQTSPGDHDVQLR